MEFVQTWLIPCSEIKDLMRPKSSTVVKTGHGFIHLGTLFVLSWWLQLWFLEFWGLLLEISVRTFLASLRGNNRLLKNLVMITNRR